MERFDFINGTRAFIPICLSICFLFLSGHVTVLEPVLNVPVKLWSIQDMSSCIYIFCALGPCSAFGLKMFFSPPASYNALLFALSGDIIVFKAEETT